MSRLAISIAACLLVTPAMLFAQTPSGTPPTASTSAPPAATMEEPLMGDHWTYEARDEITGDIKSTFVHTVTDVTPTDVSIRMSVLGNANTGYFNFDRSWNLVTNGVWKHTPNDGTGIRAPMTVGKSWSFKSTDVNSTAHATWKRSGTSKVVAQESVTTKAGTFDTFKIQTSIQLQNSIDPTKKAQSLQDTWYAPAIDHWVKRTAETRIDGKLRDKNTTELIEYGRRD